MKLKDLEFGTRFHYEGKVYKKDLNPTVNKDKCLVVFEDRTGFFFLNGETEVEVADD